MITPADEREEGLKRIFDEGRLPYVLNETKYSTRDLTLLVWGAADAYTLSRLRGKYITFQHAPPSRGQDESGRPWFIKTSRNTIKKEEFDVVSLLKAHATDLDLSEGYAQLVNRPSEAATAVARQLAQPLKRGGVVTLPKPVRSGKHLAGLDAIVGMSCAANMRLPAFASAQVCALLSHFERRHSSYNKPASPGTIHWSPLSSYQAGAFDELAATFPIHFSYEGLSSTATDEQKLTIAYHRLFVAMKRVLSNAKSSHLSRVDALERARVDLALRTRELEAARAEHNTAGEYLSLVNLKGFDVPVP